MKRKLSIGILCCAVAGLLSVCAIGCTEEDAPNNPAPALILDDAGNITRTTATVSGQIEGNRKSVRSCGFMYSTAKSDLQVSSDSGASVQEVAVAESGAITATLANLQAGTTYHYCFFAVSGVTKVLSEIKEFKTTTTSAPVLGPIVQKEVDGTDVTLQCQILDKGGADLTQFGFEYKKINETSYTSRYLTAFDEGSSDTFTMTLMLEGGVTYEIRAVAINKSNTESTGYSEVIQVTTDSTAPSVEIQEMETGDIGADYVKVMGLIADSKGGEIEECGFLWSTTNELPKIGAADGQQKVEEISERFVTTISGLHPNTTYYLRAYAISKIASGESKTGYSKVIAFRTVDYVAPTFNNVSSGSVTQHGARLNAEMNAGTATVWEKGFCWSTDANPTINNIDNHQEVDGNEFELTVKDLKSNTKYYFRAYAIYQGNEDRETCYSESSSFTTLVFTAPVLSAVTISGISMYTAQASASITDKGDGEIQQKGFCWGTSANVTLENCAGKVEDANVGYDFSGQLAGLTPNTTYYVKAYAINVLDEETVIAYSDCQSFTTETYQAPSFLNLSAEPTHTTAMLRVQMSSGNATIVEKGFCWSPNGLPTVNSFKQEVQGDEFVATIAGLISNTLYYYRAYVIYQYGNETPQTVYSDRGYFETMEIAPPSFSHFHVTASLFSINVEVFDALQGDGEITERGVCWSTTSSKPTLESNEGMAIIPEGADFKYTIENLRPNTYYYVAVYAKTLCEGELSIGYGYSGCITEALQSASVHSPTYDNVTKNSFSVSSVIIDSGNTEVTEVGFCWATSPDTGASDIPASNRIVAEKQSDGTFTAQVTGLASGVTYYVYAYAVNSAGTSYSYGSTSITTTFIPGKEDNPSPDK